MLPLPYTQNKALGALASHLTAIEAKLQPEIRTRVVNGKKENYLVSPKAVSDGCQATVRLLVIMQLRAVEEARRFGLSHLVATDAAPTPPPVVTNNKTLAKLRKVCYRTIINHLHEAESVGIIVDKKTHGRHANYELWISTKFLWKTDSQGVTNSSVENRTKMAQAVSASQQSTNFHPFVVLEKQDTIQTTNVPVDKLAIQPEQATLTGNTGLHSSPNRPEIGPEPSLEAAQAEKEIKEQGGAAASAGVENGALQAERLYKIEVFWEKAKRELYGSRPFTEHQERMAKNAIWYGVYNGFRDNLSERQWELFHEQALERIVLARKYFWRHRDKNSALPPSAEYEPGTGYFDAANARGFNGTLKWHAESQINFHHRQVSKALTQARKDLKAHRLHQASARLQAMTISQVYHYHKKKVAKLGRGALNEFIAQLACPRS